MAMLNNQMVIHGILVFEIALYQKKHGRLVFTHMKPPVSKSTGSSPGKLRNS